MRLSAHLLVASTVIHQGDRTSWGDRGSCYHVQWASSPREADIKTHGRSQDGSADGNHATLTRTLVTG